MEDTQVAVPMTISAKAIVSELENLMSQASFMQLADGDSLMDWQRIFNCLNDVHIVMNEEALQSAKKRKNRAFLANHNWIVELAREWEQEEYEDEYSEYSDLNIETDSISAVKLG